MFVISMLDRRRHRLSQDSRKKRRNFNLTFFFFFVDDVFKPLHHNFEEREKELKTLVEAIKTFQRTIKRLRPTN